MQDSQRDQATPDIQTPVSYYGPSYLTPTPVSPQRPNGQRNHLRIILIVAGIVMIGLIAVSIYAWSQGVFTGDVNNPSPSPQEATDAQTLSNPRLVMGVTAKSTSLGVLQVTWYRTEGVSSYQIQYSTTAEFNEATEVLVQDVVEYNVEGLVSGATYYVRVRAIVDGVSAGLSPYSVPAKVTLR